MNDKIDKMHSMQADQTGEQAISSVDWVTPQPLSRWDGLGSYKPPTAPLPISTYGDMPADDKQ